MTAPTPTQRQAERHRDNVTAHLGSRLESITCPLRRVDVLVAAVRGEIKDHPDPDTARRVVDEDGCRALLAALQRLLQARVDVARAPRRGRKATPR